MTARTLFVTGTDTGCGKTLAACALIRALVAAGERVVGYKPVAAGCEATPAGLRNADALALIAAGNIAVDYDWVNPVALADPIAPHIAAADAGMRIDLAQLRAGHRRLAERADWVIVEGAGGALVPLNESQDMLDLAAGWPVLLVVAMRLGCINHALLSADILVRRSQFAGWIANPIPPLQPRLADNLLALERRMPVARSGQLGADAASAVFDLDALRRAAQSA